MTKQYTREEMESLIENIEELQDYHESNWRMEESAEMLRQCLMEIDQLRAEIDEQCHINGKGSERESMLLGRIEALQAEKGKETI